MSRTLEAISCPLERSQRSEPWAWVSEPLSFLTSDRSRITSAVRLLGIPETGMMGWDPCVWEHGRLLLYCCSVRSQLPATCGGSAGTLSVLRNTWGLLDMVASYESPGPHCQPPLVRSQCYSVSVDREAAAGSSPGASGILGLRTGLGAQWLAVRKKHFAAGEHRGAHSLAWVACRRI